MNNNKFSIIILTIGIPASGKSTWVKEYVKQHPKTFVVSSDETRKEITGTEECNPEQNDMIHDEMRKKVKMILEDENNYGIEKGIGPTIVIDATNTNMHDWIAYKQFHPTVFIAKVFDIGIDEAIQRQTFRYRKVPEEALRKYWKQFMSNRQFLPLYFNLIY